MTKVINEKHLHAIEKFKELTPKIQEAYKNYQRAVFFPGELDKKTKELIAVAIGAAIQCKYCIESHTQKALAHGATKKELNEVIHVAAAIKAGATINYGLHVHKILEEKK